MTTDLATIAANLGEGVAYHLEPRGVPLYPRLHPGCWYCGCAHPDGRPERGNSCPVRYGESR